MQAYRLETTLTQNSKLVLDSLPFQAGEQVEVIILAKPPVKPERVAYPLRGLPVTYLRPFDSAAEAEWEAAQ